MKLLSVVVHLLWLLIIFLKFSNPVAEMAEMAEITENERDNESDTERDTERAKALQQGKFKLRAAGFFLRANAGFRKKLFEHLGPNDEAPPPLQLSMYDFV